MELFVEQINPTKDRLLVRVRGSDGYTLKEGLYIQQMLKTQHPPGYGTIMACGEEVHDHRLEEGVEIMFERYAGQEVDIAGENMRILNEADLMAVIEDGVI